MQRDESSRLEVLVGSDVDLVGFIDHLPVGIFVVGADAKPRYANQIAVKIVGETMSPDAIDRGLATIFQAFIAGTDQAYPEQRRPVYRALQGEAAEADDIEIHTPNGNVWLHVWASPVFDAESGVNSAIAAFIDITDRKRAEKALLESERRAVEAALHDELTGLNNRRGLVHASDLMLKVAGRAKESLSLLYVDVNNMKAINDEHGHFRGDKALIEMGHILRETFRESDVIARVGGDEFCVLLTTGSTQYDHVPMKRLEDVLKRRNEDPEREYDLQVSVGVANLAPDENCSLDELMAEADRSMYEEKAKYKEDPRR